jgi:pyruvate dehydrogenase phosphatase
MVSETDQKSWNVEVLTQFHNGENPLEVQRVMNEHPGEPECIVDSRVLGAIAPFRCMLHSYFHTLLSADLLDD